MLKSCCFDKITEKVQTAKNIFLLKTELLIILIIFKSKKYKWINGKTNIFLINISFIMMANSDKQ